MSESKRDYNHEWHVALNKHNTTGADFKHWMYEAKTLSAEVPRLTKLFAADRLEKLPKIHRQCSKSEPKPVVDNKLKCCLGVECRKCPELIALEKAEVPPEYLDEMKAWTCAGHIVAKGGDTMGEGYILRTDDRMFWDNLHSSLAADL